jgi:Ala-tRNA(Pro) deacylase
MPLTRADLEARLVGLGIETTTLEHPPVYTVEESAEIKAALPGAHSKNLFLKDKKGRVFLVTAEADAVIDLKAISNKIGASGRVTFVKPEQLFELTGLIPGSVTPFGVVNDGDGHVTVVIDSAMLESDLLNFHPLVNTATLSIRRDDFLKFLEAENHSPLIVRVSEPA